MIEARNTKELDQINGFIHDMSFRVSNVSYDEKNRRLTVPFDYQNTGEAKVQKATWFLRKYLIPVYRYSLVFADINSFDLNETEGVDTYQFNSVEYDEDTKRLTVKTNIPLTLTANTETLSVQVEPSDKKIGEHTKKKFLIFEID